MNDFFSLLANQETEAAYGTDRMPRAIGDFISHHVYDKKLKTVHNISTSLCCRFVDVSGGVETKGKGGTSFMARVSSRFHLR